MTSITQHSSSTLSQKPSKDSTTKGIPRWRHPLLYLLSKRLTAVGIDAVTIELNNGEKFQIGDINPDTPHPRVHIKSLRMILRGWFGGLMGWAEGYMADDWNVDDTRAITHWAMANEEKLETAFGGSGLSTVINRWWHQLNDNTLRGSRKNIQYHYDLGNDFYRFWLDETMTYSAALFSSPEQSLPDAQINKYQRIVDLLGPQGGDRVLEIGCGWGGFADVLCNNHQVEYHGVTLSSEQLDWSRNRMSKQSSAHFSLTDYRELDERVDGIVSIEMFEAVGEAHWPQYFEKLKQCLKPGGIAVLQVITIDDKRFEQYRDTPDFIQKYIFPGGMLPSTEKVHELVSAHGMTLTDEQCFGRDYAETLRLWHEAFLNRWADIEKLGFDQRFYRMWRYYLAYCEAGFNTGAIDVRLYRIVNE